MPVSTCMNSIFYIFHETQVYLSVFLSTEQALYVGLLTFTLGLSSREALGKRMQQKRLVEDYSSHSQNRHDQGKVAVNGAKQKLRCQVKGLCWLRYQHLFHLLGTNCCLNRVNRRLKATPSHLLWLLYSITSSDSCLQLSLRTFPHKSNKPIGMIFPIPPNCLLSKLKCVTKYTAWLS